MAIKPIDPNKRQDWIVRSDDDEVFATLHDKNYYELQLYCMGTWPVYYAADRLMASPLDNGWKE